MEVCTNMKHLENESLCLNFQYPLQKHDMAHLARVLFKWKSKVRLSFLFRDAGDDLVTDITEAINTLKAILVKEKNLEEYMKPKPALCICVGFGPNKDQWQTVVITLQGWSTSSYPAEPEFNIIYFDPFPCQSESELNLLDILELILKVNRDKYIRIPSLDQKNFPKYNSGVYVIQSILYVSDIWFREQLRLRSTLVTSLKQFIATDEPDELRREWSNLLREDLTYFETFMDGKLVQPTTVANQLTGTELTENATKLQSFKYLKQELPNLMDVLPYVTNPNLSENDAELVDLKDFLKPLYKNEKIVALLKSLEFEKTYNSTSEYDLDSEKVSKRFSSLIGLIKSFLDAKSENSDRSIVFDFSLSLQFWYSTMKALAGLLRLSVSNQAIPREHVNTLKNHLAAVISFYNEINRMLRLQNKINSACFSLIEHPTKRSLRTCERLKDVKSDLRMIQKQFAESNSLEKVEHMLAKYLQNLLEPVVLSDNDLGRKSRKENLQDMDDREIIQDLASLRRVKNYLNISLTVAPDRKYDSEANDVLLRAVTRRALQVTGEYLKNKGASRHLSEETSDKLNSKAGLPLIELNNLRNTLSHCSSLISLRHKGRESTRLQILHYDLGKIKKVIDKMIYRLEMKKIRKNISAISMDVVTEGLTLLEIETAIEDHEEKAKFGEVLAQIKLLKLEQILDFLETSDGFDEETSNKPAVNLTIHPLASQTFGSTVTEISLTPEFRQYLQVISPEIKSPEKPEQAPKIMSRKDQEALFQNFLQITISTLWLTVEEFQQIRTELSLGLCEEITGEQIEFACTFLKQGPDDKTFVKSMNFLNKILKIEGNSRILNQLISNLDYIDEISIVKLQIEEYEKENLARLVHPNLRKEAILKLIEANSFDNLLELLQNAEDGLDGSMDTENKFFESIKFSEWEKQFFHTQMKYLRPDMENEVFVQTILNEVEQGIRKSDTTETKENLKEFRSIISQSSSFCRIKARVERLTGNPKLSKVKSKKQKNLEVVDQEILREYENIISELESCEVIDVNLKVFVKSLNSEKSLIQYKISQLYKNLKQIKDKYNELKSCIFKNESINKTVDSFLKLFENYALKTEAGEIFRKLWISKLKMEHTSKLSELLSLVSYYGSLNANSKGQIAQQITAALEMLILELLELSKGILQDETVFNNLQERILPVEFLQKLSIDSKNFRFRNLLAHGDSFLEDLVPELDQVVIHSAYNYAKEGEQIQLTLEGNTELFKTNSLGMTASESSELKLSEDHLSQRVLRFATTDIIVAVSFGDASTVHYYTAFWPFTSKLKTSAVHIASAQGNSEVLENLVTHGFNVNTIDAHGWSPVHYAGFFGNRTTLTQLLEMNCAAIPALNGNTLLHLCALGNIDCVQVIWRYDASTIDARNQGLTALDLAVIKGDKSVVEFFTSNFKIDSPTTLTRALENAAESNDIELVMHLLSLQSTRVNLPTPKNLLDRTGSISLHHAVRNSNVSMAEKLLEHGAWILDTPRAHSLCSTELPRSSLSLAVNMGNLEIVQLLLTVTPAEVINQTDADQRTLLFGAAMHGHWNVFQYLIEKGANIKPLSSFDGTVLHVAARKAPVEIVKLLCEKSTTKEINYEALFARKSMYSGLYRSTPAQIAAVFGKLENLKTLAEYGADISHLRKKASAFPQNITNYLTAGNAQADLEEPISLLLESSQIGSLSMVDYLLNRGVNKNQILLQAVANEEFEIVKYLLGLGGSLSSRNRDWDTLLHIAVSKNDLGMTSFLLENTVTLVNGINKIQRTPIYFAKNDEILDVLLNQARVPHNLTQKDKDGITPVLFFAMNNLWSKVKMLIKHGFDCKTESVAKLTPLMCALKDTNCPEETIQALIAAGADPMYIDAEGCTMLHRYAEEISFCNRQRYLPALDSLESNQRAQLLSHQDRNGDTPIHRACKLSAYDEDIRGIIIDILKLNPDLALKNKDGKTAEDLAREANMTYSLASLQSQMKPKTDAI